jgi:AcrR family transcriptional regulator
MEIRERMAHDETRRAEPRGAALALILAAERLIAAHGSHIVTARDITEAAGAANSSAINYHFGSRETLLLATFQYRIGGINAHRHIYLDELAKADKLLDQQSLVRAMVYPLSEQLAPRTEGNHYLRFLERTTREKLPEMLLWTTKSGLPTIVADQTPEWASPTEVPKMLSDITPLLTGWLEVERHMARTLAWMPPAVVDYRMHLVREHVVSGLASIEAMLELRATSPADVPLQIAMLIDATVAMLAGPIAPEIFQMLNVTDRREQTRHRAAPSGRAKQEKKTSEARAGRSSAKSS